MQAQTRIPDFVVEGMASSRNQSDGDPHAYQELDVIPTASNQTVYRTFDFEYRSDKHSVTLPANMDLYTSAKNSPNKPLWYTSEE